MTAQSPYSSLEPMMWRRLLARAAVYHATRATLARWCDEVDRYDALRLVMIELDMVAYQCSGVDGDDLAVVADVVRQWEEVIARTLSREHVEQEALRLLEDLRGKVGSATGDDPFDLLFHGIQAQAEALYGTYWRPSRLSIAHSRSHPRGADLAQDPYPITAVTAWPPQPHEAKVELQICCEKFGPAAFAALPILLTHEFVCHVPARQKEAKNDSEFAEGLLDWAAYYFLHRWAGKIDPELAPAARTHADRLKHVLASRAASPTVRARRMGHDAAENLVGWLEQECRLPIDECETRVALLAVQLNQVERPLDIKDQFVSRLSWPPIPPPLDERLRAWVAGGTRAEQLLDAA